VAGMSLALRSLRVWDWRQWTFSPQS